MFEGLGFGKRKLIDEIIKQNWGLAKSEDKKSFTRNELMYIIQEMGQHEGKQYLEGRRPSIMFGYEVFRQFVQLVLYRNIANFDSMVLITAEKGCITGDALLEMPRNLIKYPKGIPLIELEGKGPQYVYSFNNNTQKLEIKKCDGIEFVKEVDVWEVELTNNQKIQTTEDHPFLQINGNYKQLKDLLWSKKKDKNRYMEKGKLIYTDRLRMMIRPDKTNKDNILKIDYSPIKWKEGDTSYNHTEFEHRFIFEQIFGKIKDNNIVHHINHNHFDNRIENLGLLNTQSDHFFEHNMNKYLFTKNNGYQKYRIGTTFKKGIIKPKSGSIEFIKQCKQKRLEYCNQENTYFNDIKYKELRSKLNKNSAKLQDGGIIKCITYIGKKKVYDVVNVEDNHNFIVNGFVVSNTGKSSAAIMLARFWCKLIGIKFDPDRHIAYNNADMMRKIDNLNKFEPIIADEAIRFAGSEDWAKKENKELKKKLAQIRTKHLFFILCFPLKIYKVEKTYLENFVNYWIDLYGRGVGAIYVKDKNPVQDSWRMKEFANIGSFNEFTNPAKILDKLKKHPNFWMQIRFPRVPIWLYEKYLRVREKNIYDDDIILGNVSKEDVHRALLIMALRDIMLNDQTLTMNRIILHLRNEYDVNLTKGQVQAALEDAKMLVMKVREKAIEA